MLHLISPEEMLELGIVYTPGADTAHGLRAQHNNNRVAVRDNRDGTYAVHSSPGTNPKDVTTSKRVPEANLRQMILSRLGLS